MPKVSIIVPVYNTEKSLPRCIDSILAQTFTDFEVLLIDDGSTDESGRICDFYVSRDSRCKVFHQQNKGVSEARNCGLCEMTGDFVTFVDSDDWIQKDFLYKCLAYDSYDVIVCAYILEPSHIVRQQFEMFCNHENMGKVLQKYIFPDLSASCAKIYKTSIIKEHKILYDKNIFSGEDTLWISLYLQYATSLAMISYIGYIYECGNSVLSTRAITFEQLQNTIERIGDSYVKLGTLFNVDFIGRVYDVASHFFGKFIMGLGCRDLKYIEEKLIQIKSIDFVRELFNDKKYLIKGKSMVVFDWLMIHQQYKILSLYVKLFKRYR